MKIYILERHLSRTQESKRKVIECCFGFQRSLKIKNIHFINDVVHCCLGLHKLQREFSLANGNEDIFYSQNTYDEMLKENESEEKLALRSPEERLDSYEELK